MVVLSRIAASPNDVHPLRFAHDSASCCVIICTHQRPEHLENCLRALAQQTYRTFDILVVDSAPTDDRTRKVAEHWGVGYTTEPQVGLSKARNHGICCVSSDVIAFVDDDSLPEREWLGHLLERLYSTRAAAVTGRVLAYIEAPVGWRVFSDHYDAGEKDFAVDRSTPEWFSLANFGGLGVGANMAFRRECLESIGFFDERLGRGGPLQAFEESHVFFRLIESGRTMVYSASAVVHHPHRPWIPKEQISATAYMALLFTEHPRYRRELLGHMRRRIRAIPLIPNNRSSLQMLLSRLVGPLEYAKVRFSGDSPTAAPVVAPKLRRVMSGD